MDIYGNHCKSLIFWIASKRIASSFKYPSSFWSSYNFTFSGFLCLFGSLMLFSTLALKLVNSASRLLSL